MYCASSSRVASLYTEAATRLGSLIARAGMTLVTGAGCQGLMRAVEDGALDEGGKAIGVIPRFMIDAGWQHPALTELRITENMHERKQLMADLSDAVVALPGGCGTMEELLEIITWKQLGLYLNPIVILNVGGYYDHLIKQLEHAVDEHFMGEIHSKTAFGKYSCAFDNLQEKSWSGASLHGHCNSAQQNISQDAVEDF